MLTSLCSAAKFGAEAEILDPFAWLIETYHHYSLLNKLIVFALCKHENICMAWPNCRAGTRKLPRAVWYWAGIVLRFSDYESINYNETGTLAEYNSHR